MPEETRGDVEAYVERLHHKMLNLAAIIFPIEAEPEFAHERAITVATDIHNAIRIFHPFADNALKRVNTNLFGHSYVLTNYSFVTEKGESLSAKEEAFGEYKDWILTKDSYEASKIHFVQAVELAALEKRNNFSDFVWNSLVAFSKSLSYNDLDDRIAARCSVMEIIFLKDGNENISENVANRMAFALA